MRICACICSASTHDAGCTPSASGLGKSVQRAGGPRWTSLPPWTRVRRILARSMTNNQGPKKSSCKFFGDRVRLCCRLLGEPQGLPRLRACDPLEAAQGCAACRTPTPPRGLLACPTALLDPCVQPATAQGLARPLAAAGSDALRLLRLDGGDERLPGLGGGGAHGGLEGRAGRGRAPGPQGVQPARDGDRCRLLGACAPAPPRPPL